MRATGERSGAWWVLAALGWAAVAYGQPRPRLECGPLARGRPNAARSGCLCAPGFQQEFMGPVVRCRPAVASRCAPGEHVSEGHCCRPGEAWDAAEQKCLVGAPPAVAADAPPHPAPPPVVAVGHAVVGPAPRCAAGMVGVPSGEFFMGSADGTGDRDERPSHRVALTGFCIDRTEVTLGAYRRCERARVCAEPACTRAPCNDHAGVSEQHPINGVTWAQANAYCRWAGGRLPTEAEWEYAARGSDGRLYPWGSESPQGRACYDRDEDDGTCPVGSFPGGASPFGALDMAGNVREWTADREGSYEGDLTTAVRDPTGPTRGDDRMHRGGGWNSDEANELRATAREDRSASREENDLGFRCVRGAR